MIALGTMTWGRETDAGEAAECYAVARQYGISHFDTAHIYGGGKSEEILSYLIDDDVFVSTKVGYNGGDLVSEFVLSRARLGRNPDLVFHHHWDLRGDIQDLANLSYELESRSVGLSNCSAWRALQAYDALWRYTRYEVSAIQVHLNLFKQQARAELLPLAKHMGWKVMAYSPLAAGALTGKYNLSADMSGRLDKDDRYAERYRGCVRAPEKFLALAAYHRIEPAAIALRWVESLGVIPIIGARNAKQLEKVLLPKIPDGVLKEAEQCFPPAPSPTDRPEEV